MNKKSVVGLTIGVVFIIGCGADTATSSDENRLDKMTEPTQSVKGNPPAQNNKIESGTWKVGVKDDISAGIITPGEYVVTANEDGFGCVWQRVRNFDGGGNSAISVGVVEIGKSHRVNVKKTDKGLQLDGDCLAKKSK